jgi:hypothetical protein
MVCFTMPWVAWKPATRPGRRRRGDEQPRPGRAHEGEQELADAERSARGDEADDNRAEPARAGAIGPCAGGHAREERQREDGKREEQPAEEADGGDAEENAEKIMVVSP